MVSVSSVLLDDGVKPRHHLCTWHEFAWFDTPVEKRELVGFLFLQKSLTHQPLLLFLLLLFPLLLPQDENFNYIKLKEKPKVTHIKKQDLEIILLMFAFSLVHST